MRTEAAQTEIEDAAADVEVAREEIDAIDEDLRRDEPISREQEIEGQELLLPTATRETISSFSSSTNSPVYNREVAHS